MNYKVLSQTQDKSLLDRLLEIRGISDRDDFLHPTLANNRHDPLELNDMDQGTDLLIQAMKDRKSICIFWDYDVDGITSSYILYLLIRDYFRYPKIKIMYPDRLRDGYGLKIHHVNKMKAAGHEVIITVDNWITSIQEVLHAKNLGMQIIITDHHKALEIIPEAHAVINPQISPSYKFKWLAWAGVAFKFASVLLKKSKLSSEEQQQIMNYLLPYVSIATVADCVPLLDENRAIVKRWLRQMTRRKNLLPSLRWLLDFVNITWPLKTHHIGFVIGPRINAGGRLTTGYDSLKTLLYTGNKQLEALQNLDNINTERKTIQNTMLSLCKELINPNDWIHVVIHESFHEGVVGIVAGRLTEQYNKPSIVLHQNVDKSIAVWSLRWPDYFDVMDMMKWIQKKSKTRESNWILIRFWWHKQAGWLTVALKNVTLLKELAYAYIQDHIQPKHTKKVIAVDTYISEKERDDNKLTTLEQMEPFWIANEEPTFILQDTKVKKIETIGKKWKWHLKLTIKHGEKTIESLYWSKGDRANEFNSGQEIDIIWTLNFDNYKKTHYISGIIKD